MKSYPLIRGMVVVCALLCVAPGALRADPCLVVYPDCPCTYHYDPAEYYTVGPGHPLYDAAYDRGGYVLLETGTDEVDESIYQAPQLMGFESSVDGNEGYVFNATDFTFYLDGFSNSPTTYYNIFVVFDQFDPSSCTPSITVNGEPLAGSMFAAGDLVVSTPTPSGNNYSDKIIIEISWRGCYGLHIWAFSDEDYNGVHDGGECFTAYSHDMVVPVEATSWGAIKSLYR